MSEMVKECKLASVRKNLLEDLKKSYMFDKSRDFVTKSANKTIRMTIVNKYSSKHDEFGNRMVGEPAFIIVEFITTRKYNGAYQVDYNENSIKSFMDLIRKNGYGEYKNINGKFKWNNIDKILFYNLGYI